jgi:hypothetical protein
MSTPNDLTRQQLDELDALLQRMLAVPIGTSTAPSSSTSNLTIDPPSVPEYRQDSPSAPNRPHILPMTTEYSKPTSLPIPPSTKTNEPSIIESRIDPRQYLPDSNSPTIPFSRFRNDFPSQTGSVPTFAIPSQPVKEAPSIIPQAPIQIPSFEVPEPISNRNVSVSVEREPIALHNAPSAPAQQPQAFSEPIQSPTYITPPTQPYASQPYANKPTQPYSSPAQPTNPTLANDEDIEPNITVEPPAIAFEKEAEIPLTVATDDAVPLTMAEASNPDLFAPPSKVPIYALPVLTLNNIIEGGLKILGPIGDFLQTGRMKFLLGTCGIGLLALAAAWTARGTGWIRW